MGPFSTFNTSFPKKKPVHIWTLAKLELQERLELFHDNRTLCNRLWKLETIFSLLFNFTFNIFILLEKSELGIICSEDERSV